jgi:hypothetical protein
MSFLTSTASYSLTPAIKPVGVTVPLLGKSLLRRLYDRLMEARMRQAQDVLKQHSHLVPRELEQAGWKVSTRSEDSLPFVR